MLPYAEYVPPVTYAVFSALFGTMSVTLAKVLSELATLLGGGTDIFFGADAWFTWVTLVGWLFFVGVWLFRMNEALSLYDPLFIIPLLQVNFILFAILGGGIFFKEFSYFRPLNTVGFLAGVLLLFLGIFLLSPASRKSGGGGSGGGGSVDSGGGYAQEGGGAGLLPDSPRGEMRSGGADTDALVPEALHEASHEAPRTPGGGAAVVVDSAPLAKNLKHLEPSDPSRKVSFTSVTRSGAATPRSRMSLTRRSIGTENANDLEDGGGGSASDSIRSSVRKSSTVVGSIYVNFRFGGVAAMNDNAHEQRIKNAIRAHKHDILSKLVAVNAFRSSGERTRGVRATAVGWEAIGAGRSIGNDGDPVGGPGGGGGKKGEIGDGGGDGGSGTFQLKGKPGVFGSNLLQEDSGLTVRPEILDPSLRRKLSSGSNEPTSDPTDAKPPKGPKPPKGAFAGEAPRQVERASAIRSSADRPPPGTLPRPPSGGDPSGGDPGGGDPGGGGGGAPASPKAKAARAPAVRASSGSDRAARRMGAAAAAPKPPLSPSLKLGERPRGTSLDDRSAGSRGSSLAGTPIAQSADGSL